MQEGQTRKRHAQAAATREQLLAAAREVFAERGYQATTVGAITTTARTAHGTFYLYFRNKEDVFVTLVEGLADEIVDQVFAPLHLDADGIASGVRAFLDLSVAHGPLWRCYLEGALTSPAILAKWIELRAGFAERVRAAVAHAEQPFDLGGLDPDVVSNALACMVEWTITTQFVLGLPPAAGASIDATASTLAEMVRRVLLPE